MLGHKPFISICLDRLIVESAYVTLRFYLHLCQYNGRDLSSVPMTDVVESRVPITLHNSPSDIESTFSSFLEDSAKAIVPIIQGTVPVVIKPYVKGSKRATLFLLKSVTFEDVLTFKVMIVSVGSIATIVTDYFDLRVPSVLVAGDTPLANITISSAIQSLEKVLAFTIAKIPNRPFDMKDIDPRTRTKEEKECETLRQRFITGTLTEGDMNDPRIRRFLN